MRGWKVLDFFIFSVIAKYYNLKYLRPNIVLQKIGFELVGEKTKVIHMDWGNSMNKLARETPNDQSLILQNYSLDHYLQTNSEKHSSLCQEDRSSSLNSIIHSRAFCVEITNVWW